jgi:hypothetical protein
MAPVVDMSSFFADINALAQNAVSEQPAVLESGNLSFVRAQTESRLLNTQALIEFGLLKARLFSGVVETNKFLEPDDQIAVSEYRFCVSLTFRKRVFVMEFRQVASRVDDCNHALELVFRTLPGEINNGGHSTLVLARENKQFIWRQINATTGWPTGNGRSLASLIIRWLQNDSGF